jgi:hypothetical protein
VDVLRTHDSHRRIIFHSRAKHFPLVWTADFCADHRPAETHFIHSRARGKNFSQQTLALLHQTPGAQKEKNKHNRDHRLATDTSTGSVDTSRGFRGKKKRERFGTQPQTPRPLSQKSRVHTHTSYGVFAVWLTHQTPINIKFDRYLLYFYSFKYYYINSVSNLFYYISYYLMYVINIILYSLL